ncbi:MAG: homocysteine S-methyltransferase family protein [Clostridia bacterium]|nr:homocysteine S-methyltransferase family protein [Clostridia bacterium]
MKFHELIEKKEFVLLDGGMGTMLQQAGLETGKLPEVVGITTPEMIKSVHSAYVNAGADIIYTCTFGANRYKLARSGYSVREVITAAIKNAKAAAGEKALVALDIGPLGKLLVPNGSLQFEEAYDAFREIVAASDGADLFVIETMTDLYELKAAILAVKENSDLPLIVSMSFEENGRTFTGCTPSAFALTADGLGVDALGINCSLGPAEMYPIISEISRWTNLPLLVKPNAGLPDPETGEYSIEAADFCAFMEKTIRFGVRFMGGCCGTTPEFITGLSKMLEGKTFVKQSKEIPSAVCTPSKTVIIDGPKIVGERLNPTARRALKEALLSDNISYALNLALEQTEGGAEILDVNVGIPDIDEAGMMCKVVKAIQEISDTPLQIDTTNPKVMERALRIYNGKPLLNSVNGEKKSMENVLPVAKKYGAALIALTLDEQGIPKTSADRIRIAKKILENAERIGIKKKEIFVDCLTLAASAEQENVMNTLDALSKVKSELGMKTALGVSNISFGLPNRPLINQTFLSMALMAGLDLPIINPNDENMTGAVRAYRMLASYDKNAVKYIEAYKDFVPAKAANQKVAQKTAPAAEKPRNFAGPSKASSAPEAAADTSRDLGYLIAHGLREETGRLTEELLNNNDPMEIVNGMLIPALDKAGSEFETGRIFLPQLIMAANCAQAAFEVIKTKLKESGASSESKGKIVLATVKGDVHDIGKNIVKVLLENYGFEVIDLGKDVEYKAVADAVEKNDVRLVGLSALMTTTLVSMKETISLLREKNLPCKIMVGGAVLTKDYAMKIGADFYARDAKESVDIAKEVLL